MASLANEQTSSMSDCGSTKNDFFIGKRSDTIPTRLCHRNTLPLIRWSACHVTFDVRRLSSSFVSRILGELVPHYWCKMQEVTEVHKVDLLEIVPIMNDQLE